MEGAAKLSIGRSEIERLIPHRNGFLLVDDVTDIDLTERALLGHRRIDSMDPVFAGHFPGNPVYPGVLQLEIIGQLGLCLLRFLALQSKTVPTQIAPKDMRAVRVHAAEFLAPVGPGDNLTVVCRAFRVDEYTGVCAGQILREGTICSFGISEAYFI